MHECMASLCHAMIFWTLDATSGYWQLEIAEEDRYKKSFHVSSFLLPLHAQDFLIEEGAYDVLTSKDCPIGESQAENFLYLFKWCRRIFGHAKRACPSCSTSIDGNIWRWFDTESEKGSFLRISFIILVKLFAMGCSRSQQKCMTKCED